MGAVIAVEIVDIEVSVDEVLAGEGPRCRTGPLCRGSIHIGQAHWDELCTGELSTGELVGNKTLICVSDRVDVIDPAKPALHAPCWQDKARVYHKSQNEHGSRGQSLLDGPRPLCDGAEDHRHGECTGEAEQKEDEKGACLLT